MDIVHGSVQADVQEKVELQEAAKRMGTSAEALRQRIRRKTVDAVKEGDRWYILMTVPLDRTDAVQTDVQSTVYERTVNVQDRTDAVQSPYTPEYVTMLEADLAAVKAELTAARRRLQLLSYGRPYPKRLYAGWKHTCRIYATKTPT
jgi:DNA-binding Lrp family transcriptional regulator